MGIKKVEPTAKKSGVMSDKSGQTPPKGKPIYVESKNNPRYTAYQDSASLYNHTSSRFKEPWASDKKFKKTVNSNKNSKEYKEALKNYYDEDVKKSNIKPASIIFSDRKKDTYIPVFKKPQQEVIVKPTTTKETTKPNDRSKKRKPTEKEIKEWSEPGFKLNSVTDYINPKTKKVGQSWYGDLTRNEQAIQNNIKPKGLIQSDAKLNADITGLKPTARTPKYYNIQENINQPFGGSQTNYRSSDLKNISSPDDLGPGNTRKITPIYQTKEDMVQTPPKKNTQAIRPSRNGNNSGYKGLSTEGKINKFLGDPKGKAVNDSDINPDENFVDNIRHASAGRYTQEAISSRFGGGVTGTIAGLIGSNLMGAAHEVRSLKEDKRPLGTKLRESGEDMFNNAVGSLVGALPTSAKSKTQTIYKSSFGNLLADGYVSTPKGKKSGLSDNLYFKDEKGNINKKY